MSRKNRQKDSYRDEESEYETFPEWVKETLFDEMDTMFVISSVAGGWVGTEDETYVIDLEDAR